MSIVATEMELRTLKSIITNRIKANIQIGGDFVQGIYKIENTKNNKKYIGSSKNIEKRFSDHKRNLKTGKHHSIKLQRAWNKSKNKNIFSFKVLEEIKDIKDFKKREQYYIDLYDAYRNGYNCTLKVDNPKYAKRNMDKKDKEKETPILQEEFMSLYNPQKIDLKAWNYKRLTNGNYKYRTYKILLACIKWFLDLYPEAEYSVQIDRVEYEDKGSICLWICYNQQDFAKYVYIKGKIILDKDYTNKMISYHKSEGIHNAMHHQLRGDVY